MRFFDCRTTIPTRRGSEPAGQLTQRSLGPRCDDKPRGRPPSGPLLHLGKRMRIRATVAAVSGALALSALAVPAAQADGSVSRADAAKILAAGQAASGKSAFSTSAAADDIGKPYALNASFSNIKINNGKAIVAGTTGTITVPITYTLTHGADVDITAEDFFTDVELYYGAQAVRRFRLRAVRRRLGPLHGQVDDRRQLHPVHRDPPDPGPLQRDRRKVEGVRVRREPGTARTWAATTSTPPRSASWRRTSSPAPPSCVPRS